MPDDQPAQGSTAEHCSAWPVEPHAMSVHIHGGALASVRRCSQCGWIDFADLDEQIRERMAEARRQATEGWDRHWGVLMDWVQGPEVDVFVADATRDDVDRYIASLPISRRGIAKVACRLVGPWGEPDDQPGGSDRA